jgi:hypothetical protein
MTFSYYDNGRTWERICETLNEQTLFGFRTCLRLRNSYDAAMA